jgi:ribosomal-protein-alanine N-acetyltransferase
MIIKTKRLILRPPRKEDWKDIVEGAGNLEVSKNLLVVPHPYTKKDAMSWINRVIKKSKGKIRNDYTFFIELKSEKKIIGATGIHDIKKDQGTATTGSWINKKYWRNGYILEAKVPILDFAFNKLKLRRIETAAYIENLGSNEMSKKLGFTQEGTKRQVVVAKATGKIHDENIYGLLKEEWIKRRPFIIREVDKKVKSVVA